MLSLKELLEKRNKVVTDMRALHEKSEGALSAEDQESYDRMKAECLVFDGQIERARELEGLESRFAGRTAAGEAIEGAGYDGRGQSAPAERGAGPATEEDRALALQAWCREQADLPLEERHVQACRRAGVRPDRPYIDVRLADRAPRSLQEARALSSVVGSQGAFTVPQTFVSAFELALLMYGGVRQAAEIIRTAGGNPMPWPTADDTSNEGEQLGESKTVTTDTDAEDSIFDQTTFYAYKYSSKLVKVPTELFEDSAFDLATVLGQMLGERISKITNRRFTTGTGAAQPSGIVTDSTLGITTAAAAAIKPDEIIQLVHSVNAAYRQGAKFMMSDQVVLAVRLLKDGNGQYMWQPGMQDGTPDRLYTYPVVINDHMATTVAASAKTMLFGQLAKYKIRDVGSFRLRRLTERFADTDQEGFVAFSRHDGHLLDAGTHPVKHLLQHA